MFFLYWSKSQFLFQCLEVETQHLNKLLKTSRDYFSHSNSKPSTPTKTGTFKFPKYLLDRRASLSRIGRPNFARTSQTPNTPFFLNYNRPNSLKDKTTPLNGNPNLDAGQKIFSRLISASRTSTPTESSPDSETKSSYSLYYTPPENMLPLMNRTYRFIPRHQRCRKTSAVDINANCSCTRDMSFTDDEETNNVPVLTGNGSSSCLDDSSEVFLWKEKLSNIGGAFESLQHEMDKVSCESQYSFSFGFSF